MDREGNRGGRAVGRSGALSVTLSVREILPLDHRLRSVFWWHLRQTGAGESLRTPRNVFSFGTWTQVLRFQRSILVSGSSSKSGLVLRCGPLPRGVVSDYPDLVPLPCLWVVGCGALGDDTSFGVGERWTVSYVCVCMCVCALVRVSCVDTFSCHVYIRVHTCIYTCICVTFVYRVCTYVDVRVFRVSTGVCTWAGRLDFVVRNGVRTIPLGERPSVGPSYSPRPPSCPGPDLRVVGAARTHRTKETKIFPLSYVFYVQNIGGTDEWCMGTGRQGRCVTGRRRPRGPVSAPQLSDGQGGRG